MKKLLSMAVLSAALATTSMAYSSVVLKTGSLEGNYHTVAGPSMVKEAKKLDVNVRLSPSTGYGATIEALKGQPNMAGLVQDNVLRKYQDEDEKYEDVGAIAKVGVECGLLVVPVSDGRAMKLSDLDGEKVAAGKPTSGTRITFDQLAELNPGLAAMKPKKKSGWTALGKVDAGSYGAMWFVNVPDPKNDIIKTVVSNPNLAFAALEDINLGSLGEGKRPALFHMDVPVKTNWSGSKVKQVASGICTNISIAVDEEAMHSNLQTKIYKASKNVRVQKSTLSSLFNDAKKKAADATSNFR